MGKRHKGAEALRPSGFQDEITWDWKQLTAFLFVVGFFIVYFFSYISDVFLDKSLGIHTFVNQQFIFVFSDWNLLLAFIIILGLTIGWYLLQYISILLIHLDIQFGRTIGRRKGTIIRYLLSIYLISLIVSYYLFNYEFNDGMLWISGVFVSAFLSVIFYGLMKLKDELIEPPNYIDKMKQVIPKQKNEYPELKSKYIIYIILILFFILSLFVLWEEYIHILQLLNSNAVISIYFSIVICCTILWKPLCFLASYLIKLPRYIIQTSIKRKINRYRIILFVFSFSMLLTKNLHFFQDLWGISAFQVQIISLFTGLIASIISWYLQRKYFPIAIIT